jgi:hypothetical protein
MVTAVAALVELSCKPSISTVTVPGTFSSSVGKRDVERQCVAPCRCQRQHRR